MSGFAGSVFGYHKPAFAPDAGVTSSLTVPDGLNIVLQQDANGNWNAVDGNGGTTVYNPDDPALGAFILSPPKKVLPTRSMQKRDR